MFAELKDYFSFTKTYKIFMKSGNVITVDHCKDIEIRYSGDEIQYLKIYQLERAKNKLFVASLNLSQIEAIVRC